MSGETYEVSIITKMDMAAVEEFYSEIATKFQNITIKPSIDVSIIESVLSNTSNALTSILGFLELGSLLKSKSASKEIEELNKLCKNSKASLGEYRKALETLDGALKAVGDSAFKAQGHTKNLNKKNSKKLGTLWEKGL